MQSAQPGPGLLPGAEIARSARKSRQALELLREERSAEDSQRGRVPLN